MLGYTIRTSKILGEKFPPIAASVKAITTLAFGGNRYLIGALVLLAVFIQG